MNFSNLKKIYRMKQIAFIFLLAICAATPVCAFDFHAVNSKGDTLYYNITSGTTVEVTYDVASKNRTNFSGHIIIPDSVCYNSQWYRVTRIGDRAFYHCILIDSVSLPEGIDSIGNWAFQYCQKLRGITLPSSLKFVGNNAFIRCSSLEQVLFTSPVCEIGTCAFAYCISMKHAVLPSKSAVLGEECFMNDSLLRTIRMPDSMEVIPNNCFCYCHNLERVELPAGLKRISYGAFYNCYQLAYCKVPPTVDSIGVVAFDKDSSLISMDLSQTKIRVLAKSAFGYCINMVEFKLPNTLKKVEIWSLSCDSTIPYIIMPESVEYFHMMSYRGEATLYNTKFRIVFKSLEPPFLDDYSLDTLIYKLDTFYVPCGSEAVYRNATEKKWWRVPNIRSMSMAKREIVLDSACAPEVRRRFGFYPTHSGTYYQKLPSGFACDSLAVFHITLSALAHVNDSSINVEPDRTDTSVTWTWEGTGVEYDVYREEQKIAVVTEPYYRDTDIMPGVQYCYNFVPINAYGCEGEWSGTNCYTMVFDDGIGEHTSAGTVTVRPNPATGRIFIDNLPEALQGAELVVYDATGREVLRQDYTPAGADVSALSRGIYFLRIGSLHGKFVKM